MSLRRDVSVVVALALGMSLGGVATLGIVVHTSVRAGSPPLTHEQISQAVDRCARLQLHVRFDDDGRGRPVWAWCGSE